MERLPIPEVRFLLSKSYSKETSFTPNLWTPENPTQGQCAITVLLAQDLLGGEIKRAIVPKNWEEKLGYPSHYFNVLENGKRLDLTKKQFTPDFPYDDFVEGRVGQITDVGDTREYLLKNAGTNFRYHLLKSNFETNLDSEPLFKDEKHKKAWDLAFSGEAVCPKLRFACLVYYKDSLIATSTNKLMTEQFGRERFCSLAGKNCIREGISSRVDSVIGDCGHAIIWALKDVFNKGFRPFDLPSLDFYEAGFNPKDFSPWWGRTEDSYTCTDCENRFAVLGLDKVFGVYANSWTAFKTQDSFYSSAKYALKGLNG